ncbi:ATP-grasp domain-containing protein [Flavobacterium sp.]|uniref:ATP-grasp domain-containing protein n=1 Tax=Flavobacterium sp. TaxID=239 RepID=UPI00262E808D|nr:ATP-grasp domain-containing protein [Flavobacterium sp.]
MKAFIQTHNDGEFYNVNAFIAYEGFKHFGFEIEKFHDVNHIEDTNPEHILVGGIGNVRKRLEMINIPRKTTEIDYPVELQHYLKRTIWKSTLEDVLQEKRFPVFIKPETETKKFPGKVFKTELDFVGLLDTDKPTSVLCSELISFKAEFRCFIRYQEILDIRHYKGDWNKTLDLEIVKAAIADFKSQPRAYALDFGVDENNATILVEVNDGHSLGSYGISATNYAKFLSARWSELTDTIDYLNF